ncbi:MAG: guanine deaminase [Proteobacteria bacterium]|nr:MAG: guanine deaminase [Pseudomonadota bacterium]
MRPSRQRAFRASLLHLRDDPGNELNSSAVQYFPDGILLVCDGYVQQVGAAADVLATLPEDCDLLHYPHHLLVPGFVDTHIHYPQTDMIAAYGEQLLEWLQTYTFPTEKQFADSEHAREVAEFFLDELLSNGTTTALVFGTVHPESVDAFFEAAAARQLRMIAGKVMMDRHCPNDLRDTPESAYQDSKVLIEKWHGRGRLAYAVTPRFAPTSSPEQLAKAQQLLAEFPDVYLHTHLAENQAEVDWVQALFPERRSYLDVYQHYGLLKPRSVLAHAIYLDDTDRHLMAEQGAAVAFCPCSNLFIGSGLFDWHKTKMAGVRVGMGTDVGGGDRFSLFQVANNAYKVTQLLGHQLSAWQALYLLTLGGAKALYLDDKIGNFEQGKEADFVVLDLQATPLLKRRLHKVRDIHDLVFALLMLADDRAVAATYTLGEQAVFKTR